MLEKHQINKIEILRKRAAKRRSSYGKVLKCDVKVENENFKMLENEMYRHIICRSE